MSLVDLGKRLLETAKRGDTEEVRTLMSNGAPFTTDWLGTSPLHFAAQQGHVSTAEILLRAGISRDARTKVDRTPLHVSCQEGHIEIVELLIRHGADVEAKDMLKMTPLHWAVEKGHVDIICLLLKQGADVTCENKFDKTPLDIAVSNGRADLFQLLQYQDQSATAVFELNAEPTKVEEVTTTEVAGVLVEEEEELGEEGEMVIEASPIELVHSDSKHRLRTLSGRSECDDSTETSSTSVLATLAALAEATAPYNSAATTTNTSTTAAEALNWLETHGITMISSSDNPTIVTSALETGQILTLTEAGKLALNSVSTQELKIGSSLDEEQQVTEETVETVAEEHVLDEQIIQETVIADELVEDADDGTQNVITIVAQQDTNEGPVLVAVEQPAAEEPTMEPSLKRHKASRNSETIVVSSIADLDSQVELRRQLEEVQKQAEKYKAQLRKKEKEAAEYKKKLGGWTG